MIWSPMVNTGLSEVIGSWKIMADRRATDLSASAARRNCVRIDRSAVVVQEDAGRRRCDRAGQ